MLRATAHLVALDTTNNLLRGSESTILRLRCRGPLPEPHSTINSDAAGWRELVFTTTPDAVAYLACCQMTGLVIDEMEIAKPDLEDVFVRIMNEKAAGP